MTERPASAAFAVVQAAEALAEVERWGSRVFVELNSAAVASPIIPVQCLAQTLQVPCDRLKHYPANTGRKRKYNLQ